MKTAISILLLLLLCFPAFSQSQTEHESEPIEIFFDLNSHAIDSTYMSNEESLTKLSSQVDSLLSDPAVSITNVVINSYSSPDGDLRLNQTLSDSRANSIQKYLTDECSVPDSLVTIVNNGIAWDQLRQMVLDSDTPYKYEVVMIIDGVPEEVWERVDPSDRWQTLVDSRNKHLMELRNGEPYRYMMANVVPKLRQSSVVVTSSCEEITPVIEEVTPAIEEVEVAELTSQLVEPQEVIMVAEVQNEELIIESTTSKETTSSLFAIKTNLLYDIAMIPNIELEIPIKNKFSVLGEWIFPWWVTSDNAYALQLLSGQIEGKYWFGNRTDKPQLTGWFAGLYAGGGLYDLQWDGDGYQGEFYIAAGLSAGFAHTINKSGSLRMEYSLGVGYLSTDYRYYEGMENNEFLVWQRDGKYTWIGPTKAKVSLVWMLGKKGGKR